MLKVKKKKVTKSGVDLDKIDKADRPYGHTGYMRTSKKGKVSVVSAKGVKKKKATPKPKSKIKMVAKKKKKTGRLDTAAHGAASPEE